MHHPAGRPDPPLAWKHAQNPPAQRCVDLGFPPGGFVQLLGAGSSEAFTPGPVRRRRRRRREAGAGAGEPASRPSAKSRLRAAVATCARQRPAGKNYTSQQAEGHRQPCKMESGVLGLAVIPRREGGHRCGEAALLREGGRLVFASVARPSFESWNMLKDGLSELLCLVLFCFK